ncbi:flagellar hook-length control protein FliK [Pseudomonas sp. LS1212]|uniref:flagellar hook-length control protein FliK n=1 Tax=Pseudomonas sp. LS1212 TaxID=2972478 RepID=UPI00215CF7DA|nr:flagellar hook-length control protein FliK [Pseudomonas sp. LS1212]UVJ45466.1 flagellar hook-length control protein FliK [Pseudomonas sp. LS1212]
MTGEINSLAPVAATPGTPRPAVPGGEILKLMQSLDGLLPTGETAKAEVLSLKQTAQDFQLLLKLTLASGRETNVQVSSKQPLSQGTQLAVTQASPNNLMISLQQALSATTLTQLDTRQLPVGTLLQGKVVTCQLLPQGPGLPAVYRAMVSLLNTAQAGATLSLDSPRPLALGSLLSAQVQGSRALSFVPLGGRLDQLALTQQLASQQARQGSVQGLLSALQKLSDSEQLPAAVRVNADQLLASLPDIRQLSDAKGLAQALGDSGAFLEARLLSGQTQALAPDLKAQLFRLVAQILPALPGNTEFNPAAAASTLAQVLPGFVRSALGTLGQVSAKPHPGAFPLPSRLLSAQEDEGDLEHLLKLAAAAVSRVQSHQLASLAQTGSTPEGNLQTTWQLEIPLRNQQEFIPLQVKLQREETPQQQAEQHAEKRDPKELLWRVELAFDMYPLGPLQVQAQLVRGSLSSQLWAEHPATARLVDSQLGLLRERLIASGLTVAELNCHHGTPPQGPRTHLEQRWVDETA